MFCICVCNNKACRNRNAMHYYSFILHYAQHFLIPLDNIRSIASTLLLTLMMICVQSCVALAAGTRRLSSSLTSPTCLSLASSRGWTHCLPMERYVCITCIISHLWYSINQGGLGIVGISYKFENLAPKPACQNLFCQCFCSRCSSPPQGPRALIKHQQDEFLVKWRYQKENLHHFMSTEANRIYSLYSIHTADHCLFTW